MSKSAMVNARIEPKLKSTVETIFRKLGLNTAQAVTLFFRHVQNHKGLPFDVRLPNAATRQAIVDARKRKNVKRFVSADEMVKELDG
jgi:DNA-damage-inducible protein J